MNRTRRKRKKTPAWLNALNESGRACDRDNTFSLGLAKGDKGPPGRPWGLTLRKRKWEYRTTQYKTRENALRGALRLYGKLMREQPNGEHGHEVDPQTAEPLETCGCKRCAEPETEPAEGPTAREEAEEWAPTWSVAGLTLRGWTGAMIRDHLGEPDAFADNPHYRSAAPMRLYRRERVEEAEESEGFAERKALAAARSRRGRETAGKAAATHKKRLTEWAETVEIHWIQAPTDAAAALRHGVSSWEAWNGEGAKNADHDTRKRWARNYVRHECMSYNNLLTEVGMSPAGWAAYQIIRDRCEALITARYPALA